LDKVVPGGEFVIQGTFRSGGKGIVAEQRPHLVEAGVDLAAFVGGHPDPELFRTAVFVTEHLTTTAAGLTAAVGLLTPIIAALASTLSTNVKVSL